MRIKQILRLTLFLPLVYYIFISQNYEDNILIRESINNTYLSDKFKIDTEGEIIFNISEKTWPFKNRLDNELLLLSVKFDNSIDFSQSDLIFKLTAFTTDKDKSLNRLILNDYVKSSDKTVFKDYKISSDEFQLGLLPNFSNEDVLVKLDISRIDKKLNHLNPRLKIESYKGSRGVYGFAGLGLILKNTVLLFSILCIIIYIIIGYTVETRNNKPCC